MKYNSFILKKEKLSSFLKAAMKDFCLVGPQEAVGGDFLLQEVEDPGKLRLDYDITANTLKEFFFPRKESIFKFDKKPRGLFKVTPIKDGMKRPVLFFGVRSCDVKAVYFQDLFFGRDPKDMLYWEKRDKGLLISFACNKPPRKSCFCAHTKSGPFLEDGEGFDLQFIDLPTDFLVEVGSQKGMDLVKRYARFFTPAGEDALGKRSSLKQDSSKEFSSKYDLIKVRDKLKSADLGELWEALGKRCTNCAGCEFICPTCFCFYQQDVKSSEDKGERIRAWDSCTFAGYSRMAGEATPHESNAERISRRFFCKLYNCYNWFSVFACTGCGRCSFVCPVNLDMESFISSLEQGNTYKPLLKEL
jgi:ferredoxin